MPSPQLWAYLVLTLALVITPGASTAVVVRNTVNGGWRDGAATALGAAFGNATIATAARLGVLLILERWPIAVAMLRWGGAIYLLVLGVSSLRRSVSGSPSVKWTPRPDGRINAWAAFRQGLTVNVLNPPVIVFYLVVLPTFLRADAGVEAFAALAGLHITMAFVCHLAWAFVFDRLRWLVRRPGPLRVFEAGAAAALLYLAARTVLRT